MYFSCATHNNHVMKIMFKATDATYVKGTHVFKRKAVVSQNTNLKQDLHILMNILTI